MVKRVRRRVAVCVVLGVVSTVAVAWAFALRHWWWFGATWNATDTRSAGVSPERPADWFFVVSKGAGVAAVSSWSGWTHRLARPAASVSVGDFPINEVSHWDPADPSSPRPPLWTWPRRWLARNHLHNRLVFRHEFASGWPALSLRSMLTVVSGSPDPGSQWSGRIPAPNWVRDRVSGMAVPWHPIWLGFLLDTMLYGCVWYGMIFGFRDVRYAVRRTRHRCGRCGYDLRGAPSEGCPECGWRRAAQGVESS